MSLVNEMLRDLHRRKGLPDDAGRVNSAIPVYLEQRRSRSWIIVLIVMLGIAFGIFAGFYFSRNNVPMELPLASETERPDATPPAAAVNPDADTTQNTGSRPGRAEPAQVTAWISDERVNENGFEISLGFSQDVDPEVLSKTDRSLHVLLTGVNNMPVSSSEIDGVVFSQGNEGITAEIDLEHEADFQVYQNIASGGHALTITARKKNMAPIVNPDESPAAVADVTTEHAEGVSTSDDWVMPISGGGQQMNDKETVALAANATAQHAERSHNAVVEAEDNPAPVRVPREMTAEQRDRNNAQQAALQIQRGQLMEAYNTLLNYLGDHPEAHQSRETLATLLFAQQEYEQAGSIVDEGLQLAPNYAGYKKIKARLLQRDGKLSAAIELLKNAPPKIENDVEYHELLASLYQRDNRYNDAINTYQGLIRFDRQQAKWWAGLAISYEALGKRQEALAGFQAALQLSGLDDGLREYSQNRVRSLRQQ